MEKERVGFRWCRLLGVETVIAVYVSCVLLRCLLRGPVCATIVSALALAYFAGALVYGNRRPEHARRDNADMLDPFSVFCWLLALVEVLIYSGIHYGL
jgi:hypothetical protein